MNGESWLLAGTAGGPWGQSPCRQIGADILPAQVVPMACWELSGPKVLPTDCSPFFTGAYAAGSLALPYCLLRSSPGGVDTRSLSRYASERCLWLCELRGGRGAHRVLAVRLWRQAERAWVRGHSPGQLQRVPSGSQHTRQGQGCVLLQSCTVVLPEQLWLIALSLSVSPLFCSLKHAT